MADDKDKKGAEGTEDTHTDGGNSQGQEAKFTQADVERFIKERFERDGIKELREKAKKFDEFQKSQMSAEDASKQTITDLQQKLSLADAERAQLRLTQLKDDLLDKAGLPRGGRSASSVHLSRRFWLT